MGPFVIPINAHSRQRPEEFKRKDVGVAPYTHEGRHARSSRGFHQECHVGDTIQMVRNDR